jgi:hypothetical protein
MNRLVPPSIWSNRTVMVSGGFDPMIIVAAVDDSDGTVCDALRKIRPDYFANGGDRGKENTPEQDVCEELDIEMLWGIGGDYKRNSSSDLAKNLVENYPKQE